MATNSEHTKAEVVVEAGQAEKVQEDVFGDEEHHDIRYKTLSWQVGGLLLSVSPA